MENEKPNLTLDWGAREEINILKQNVASLEDQVKKLALINLDLANTIYNFIKGAE